MATLTTSASSVVSTDVGDEADDADDYDITPVRFDDGSASVSSSSTPIRLPWQNLLKNELFCARIIMLLTAVFILFMSTSYTASLTLSLTLDDYWCPPLTLKDIRSHSRAHNLTQGELAGECWDTTVYYNNSKLLEKASYKSKSDGLGSTKGSVSRFILFLILTAVLFATIVYFTIRLIIDAINYRRDTLGATPKTKTHSSTVAVNSNSKNCAQRLLDYVWKISVWYSKHVRVDSGNWIILKLASETSEILLQTEALFVYNGSSLIDTTTLHIASDSVYVSVFAVFLFVNCLFVGVLWLCYAFKQLTVARNRLKTSRNGSVSPIPADMRDSFNYTLKFDKETQTELDHAAYDDEAAMDKVPDIDMRRLHENTQQRQYDPTSPQAIIMDIEQNYSDDKAAAMISSTDDLIAALQPPVNATVMNTNAVDERKQDGEEETERKEVTLGHSAGDEVDEAMSTSNIAAMARMQVVRDQRIREFQDRLRRLQELLNKSEQEHKRKDSELEYLKTKFAQIEEAQDVKRSADNSEYLKNALLQYFDGKIDIYQLESVVAVGLRFNEEEQKKAKNSKLLIDNSGIGGYVKSWWG